MTYSFKFSNISWGVTSKVTVRAITTAFFCYRISVRISVEVFCFCFILDQAVSDERGASSTNLVKPFTILKLFKFLLYIKIRFSMGSFVLQFSQWSKIVKRRCTFDLFIYI